MSAPFRIEDARIAIAVSVGVATAPQDGVHDIMRRAELALDQAKHMGGANWRFYQAQLDDAICARRALGAELQMALERDEFMLYFQPLVNAATRRVQGFEALARWRHPSRGLIPPAEFIPIAEEMGVIGSLGKWVIEEACRVAAGWPESVAVAVNISPLQLRDGNLPQIVREALARCRLPAHRLELELTESAVLETTPGTEKTLQELAEMGVRLSLDDFGTGYSSLGYLRRIAFHKIKIDQSFVHNLPEDRRDTTIVRAIVDIATTLGVSIIAEGVETEDQSRALTAHGCDQLQGYLFGKPAPADQICALLAAPDHALRYDVEAA